VFDAVITARFGRTTLVIDMILLLGGAACRNATVTGPGISVDSRIVATASCFSDLTAMNLVLASEVRK
jgi:hypothetical protein